MRRMNADQLSGIAFEDRKSIDLQSREADAQNLKPDAIEP